MPGAREVRPRTPASAAHQGGLIVTNAHLGILAPRRTSAATPPSSCAMRLWWPNAATRGNGRASMKSKQRPRPRSGGAVATRRRLWGIVCKPKFKAVGQAPEGAPVRACELIPHLQGRRLRLTRSSPMSRAACGLTAKARLFDGGSRVRRHETHQRQSGLTAPRMVSHRKGSQRRFRHPSSGRSNVGGALSPTGYWAESKGPSLLIPTWLVPCIWHTIA